MAGYFQLKSAANDKWMFNLKAGNHETIFTSQSYSSKAAASAGIESVRKAAGDDSAFERKTAADKSPYFVLTSKANGQTLGKSEMYSSATAMEGGIASVKANAPGASVKEA
jgi:uncharacterized protein